jgi:hypothetical protein
VISLGVGFHLGSRHATAPHTADGRQAEIDQAEKEDQRDEIDEEASDGNLASVQAGFMEQCKLVRYWSSTLCHLMKFWFSQGASGQDGFEDDSR